MASSSKKIQKKLLLATWACKNKNYGSGQISERILREIFEEVIVFDPQEEMYRWGQDEMNKRLLTLIEKEKPDVAFFWLIYDEFFVDTLLKIREVSPNTRLVNFFGDDDALFYSFSRYCARFFDYCLVFQRDFVPEYKKEEIRNVFTTMGVDIEKYRPLEIAKKYDVSFIGTPKNDRYALVKYLVEQRKNVRVFGAGWERYPDLREIYGGKLSNEDIVRIINESKINLSFTKNYEGTLHFKGRIVEIAACRSFSLGEYFEGYHELFEKDKEIVMFKDRDDLLHKIRYYLEHEKEREKIAELAYTKAVKNLSLEKEMKSIVGKILKRKRKGKLQILPPIAKKVLYLTESDLSLSKEELRAKAEGFNYIGFKEKNSEFLPYKEYFQVHSLETSKKQISCCDYYVYAWKLGNFLACQMNYACNSLQRKDFTKLLISSQIMTKKPYFIENISHFKQLVTPGKFECVNESTTAFVSIPLVRTKTMRRLEYDIMEKVFLPKFEDKLRTLAYQKRVFTSAYLYAFILASLFGKPFLLRRAARRFVHTRSSRVAI